MDLLEAKALNEREKNMGGWFSSNSEIGFDKIKSDVTKWTTNLTFDNIKTKLIALTWTVLYVGLFLGLAGLINKYPVNFLRKFIGMKWVMYIKFIITGIFLVMGVIQSKISDVFYA